MRILILCSDSSGRGEMVYGFLRLFDPSLELDLGSDEAKHGMSEYAVHAMQAQGIDITAIHCYHTDIFKAQKWDYILTLTDHDQEIASKLKERSGGQSIEMEFVNPLVSDHTTQTNDDAYITLRDKMSIILFDFYLRDIKDKEILGDDGCGVWCDV